MTYYDCSRTRSSLAALGELLRKSASEVTASEIASELAGTSYLTELLSGEEIQGLAAIAASLIKRSNYYRIAEAMHSEEDCYIDMIEPELIKSIQTGVQCAVARKFNASHSPDYQSLA